MRWVAALAMVMLLVGAVEAQVAWVGAGAGTSFEYKAQSAPDKTWKHRTDLTPQVFVALPLADTTMVRLGVGEIPYDLRLLTGNAELTLRRYTIGIDYFFRGQLSDTVFSGGLGGYTLEVDHGIVPESMQATKLGYYLGVGEWFTLSRRWRLSLEATMHRSENEGRPTLVTTTAGVAFSF